MLDDRVELPRRWHSPAMFADGDAELDIVADVLATEDVAAAVRWFMSDALPISAYQLSREMGGMFRTSSHASRNRAAELNAAILGAIVGYNGGLTLKKSARRGADRSATIYRLQTIGGGGGGSAERLQHVCRQPAARRRSAALLRRHQRRGAAAVSRCFINAPSVSLSVVPKGRRDLALPDATGYRDG